MRRPFGAPGPGPDSGRGSRGLSLIEVMVVMTIVAIGWFSLLPNLDLAESEDQAGTEISALNRLLVKARQQALSDGEIQVFGMTKGMDTVTWKDDEVQLPSYVAYFKVNEERPAHRSGSFRVYPGGFMDDVELALSMGETWISEPLSVSFAQREE